MTIKIIIKSTNQKVSDAQQAIIIELCADTNTPFLISNSAKYVKEVKLLKSPHIHKGTWRTYVFKSYKTSIRIFDIPNVKSFTNKLALLLKVLEKKSYIRVTYHQDDILDNHEDTSPGR